MKKLIVCINLILILIFCLTDIAAARTYKINGKSKWIGWAAVDIAVAKGFWKENGLDVECVEYANDIEINEAVNDKSLDFAITMIGSAVSTVIGNDAKLKLLMETDWSDGGDKIILKKGTKIDNLKNSNIGVYVNSLAFSFYLDKFARKNNLKIDDFKIVEIEEESLLGTFKLGRIKAMIHYDPFAGRAVKEAEGEVISTTADFPGCFPEGIVIRADLIKEMKPEEIKGFIKGYLKAVEWMLDPKNSAECVKLINEKTFVGGKYNESEIKEMFATVKIHGREELLKRHKDNEGVFTYLKELKNFIAENKYGDKEFNIEEFTYFKPLIEVLNSK